jgi:hypothetical protein
MVVQCIGRFCCAALTRERECELVHKYMAVCLPHSTFSCGAGILPSGKQHHNELHSVNVHT